MDSIASLTVAWNSSCWDSDVVGNGIPWYKQITFIADPAVRDRSDLLPVTYTLGSACLWLPARAVEPKVLH